MKKYLWRILFLILLCIVYAYTQSTQIKTIYDFSGGINNLTPANLIADNEINDCYNVFLDEGGGISNRWGNDLVCTVIGSTHNVRALAYWYTNLGNEYLIAISSKTIGYCNFTTKQLVPIYTGIQYSTSIVNMCSAEGKLFVASDSENLAYLTETALNNFTYTIIKDTHTPIGCRVKNYHNRLCVTGDWRQPNKLFLSKYLDATSSVYDSEVTSSSVASSWKIDVSATPDPSRAVIWTVGLNDGDKNTGIYVYNNWLIIFKERSMWSFSGYDNLDFNLVNISQSIGCINGKSIADKDGYLVWVSKRGIERFNGSIIEWVSRKIPVLISNFNNSELVAVCGYDNRYYLSYTNTGGAAGRTLVLDKNWAFTEFHFDNDYQYSYAIYGNDVYWGGGRDAANIYKYSDDQYTDDNHNGVAAAITNQVITKNYDLGIPYAYKTFKDIWLVNDYAVIGSTISVSAITDKYYTNLLFYTYTNTTKTYPLVQKIPFAYTNAYNVQRSKHIQFTITLTGSTTAHFQGLGLIYDTEPIE